MGKLGLLGLLGGRNGIGGRAGVCWEGQVGAGGGQETDTARREGKRSRREGMLGVCCEEKEYE